MASILSRPQCANTYDSWLVVVPGRFRNHHRLIAYENLETDCKIWFQLLKMFDISNTSIVLELRRILYPIRLLVIVWTKNGDILFLVLFFKSWLIST